MVLDFKDKSIAVIGMARTGLAVAEVMTELGARVVLCDKKSESELGDALDSARRIGVETRVGTNDIDLTGVDLVVPSPGVPRGMAVFAEAKKRGIEVISEIELAYRLAKAPIIAITGTNGKTTTTVLAGKIMQADGRETYIAGNVVAGDIRLPLIVAAHKASANGVIIAEISTFQLEWISTFKPKAAALLNIGTDHMDRHSSIEEYAGLKARIFENQTPDDFAVINIENPFTASIASTLKGHLLPFARKSELSEGGFVRGDELVVRINGVESVVCTRSDIPLRGEHNVENILAAACACLSLGARPESVTKAVREFKPVEHRLEPVGVVDGVEYINNSMCTNVEAAVRSVEAISEPQIVIAGGKDKGLDYRPLGEAFKRKAKHVVLIGVDADILESAARSAGFEDISRAGSLQEAVKIAHTLAVPGDVVVLTPSCASFDMFTSFEDRGQTFKRAVKALADRRL